MIQKDGSILITAENLLKGQGSSPYSGMGKIVNLDLFSSPGAIKLQNKTVLSFSTLSLPIAIKRGGGFTFTGCLGGQLYRDGSLLTTGVSTTIFDLLVVGQYLIIARPTALDLYGPFGTSPSYTANWKTGLTSGFWHKLIFAPDKNVYVTDSDSPTGAGTMAKLEISSLTATSISATLTPDSLILPSGRYGRTLAMAGKYILIGTQGGSSYTDFGSEKIAEVYPWDYASGATYVEDPVSLNENGILQMFGNNNLAYMVAGLKGKVYECDSVSYRRIKKLSLTSTPSTLDITNFYPNAISLFDDELLIGSSKGSYTTLGEANVRHGVYGISLSEGYPAVLRNGISTGSFGTTSQVNIGVIAQLGSQTFQIGWQDGTSYGVDLVDATQVYTNFTGLFETPLLKIAELGKKKQYEQLLFQFGRDLSASASQKIRFRYREALDDEYTAFGSDDGIFESTDISGFSHECSALLPELENAQFEVALSGTGPNSPELLTVHIK
jgi:hypothetical protein